MPDDAKLLMEFVADRDVACPLCGYNLRALQSTRCPECGRELQLSVGLTEPSLRTWIITAVFLCANAGIGLLFLVLTVRYGFPSHRMETVIICYIGSIVPACIVVWKRRAILRWPRPLQDVLALLTGIGSLALFGWAIATVK